MESIPVTRIFPRDPGVSEAIDVTQEPGEKPTAYYVMLTVQGPWKTGLVTFCPYDGTTARRSFLCGGNVDGRLTIPGVGERRYVLHVDRCGQSGSLQPHSTAETNKG